jgi:hypothetical protein
MHAFSCLHLETLQHAYQCCNLRKNLGHANIFGGYFTSGTGGSTRLRREDLVGAGSVGVLSASPVAKLFVEGIKGSESCECGVGDGGMRSRCGDMSHDSDDESD